jgi:DNA-binding transcriptional LysR family regulator
MGLGLCEKIKAQYPRAVFEFQASDDARAIEKVERGEAHVAIITSDLARSSDLVGKVVGDAKFQTFVGPGHPLYSVARAKKSVPVEDLLRHAFVSPSNPLLGQVGLKQSLDGWRDDAFPRRVDYRTSSLKILEEFVATGKAVGYLPDYFCRDSGFEVLKVTGCPYSCVQKVRLVAKNPKDVGWLNQIF